MAYHPEIQHLFSEMQLEIESMWPHLERVAEDWSAGVDHGAAWPMKIVAAKYDQAVSSSACTATSAPVASTLPTPCSRTRSWARPPLASALTNSHAEARRNGSQAVTAAHQQDLAVQARYGARFIR
jgi:hypothetical protein